MFLKNSKTRILKRLDEIIKSIMVQKSLKISYIHEKKKMEKEEKCFCDWKDKVNILNRTKKRQLKIGRRLFFNANNH
jgi:hypothetical protein